MGGEINTATFAVKLTDETSAPARDASVALAQLKRKLEDDTRALREMNAAMRRLKGGTVTDVAAFRQLRDKITAQKASLAQAQSSYVSLGGSFRGVARDAGGASRGFGDLAGVAQRMPGPLGGLVSRLGALRGLLAGGVIAGGVLAIVAALAALVAASAAAAAALLRYGIAQSDARRSELLRLEGLTTLRNRYGVAAGSATELQAAIDRVSDSSALGRAQIEGMSRGLYRAGLRGAALSETLEALAIVESVQGEVGVRRMRGRLIADARAGRSAQRLADVRGRLGAIAARQAMGLDRQAVRLRESMSRIFDGLELDGLLRGLHEVTSLFSQQTATGRALKTIFEALFQPMLDAIATLGPIAKRFFQGMVIGALLATIAVQRLSTWLSRTFGGATISQATALRVALFAGVAVFFVLAAAVVVATVAFVALAASMAAIMAIPFAIVAALGLLVSGLIGIGHAIASIEWVALGRSIVDGLVGGLRSGRDRIVASVRGIAGDAQRAFRDVLGIHSPSSVFAELGRALPAGIAVGVESGSEGAQAAVEGMVSPSSGRGGSRRSESSISIGEITIHTAATDARGIAADIGDALRELMQGLQVEQEVPA